MARILVVDDEELDRTLGKSILEQAGHELLYAPNGEVALRIFESQSIDVVITDLAMPNLNGLRLIQEIRAHDPDALIVAVSGVAADQLDRAADLGAALTLAKPYSSRALLDAVTGLLDGRLTRPRDDPWGF
jgi:CheY-like chemotaxis protein